MQKPKIIVKINFKKIYLIVLTILLSTIIISCKANSDSTVSPISGKSNNVKLIQDENNSVNSSNSSTLITVSSETKSTPPVDEHEMREIAKKLYKEFIEYSDMYANDDKVFLKKNYIRGSDNTSAYDAVMAIDRATGILGVYKPYFTDEEIVKVNSRYKKIQDEFGNGFPIYYGYSKAGLHFIVISPNFVTGDGGFKSAINKIRNDSNEMNFLNDTSYICIENDFRILDVFAEDLTNKSDNIKYDISISYLDGSSKFDSKIIEKPDIEKLNKYFTNYKRSYSQTPETKDKEWRLIFFDKYLGWPDITINYKGEEINLIDE